MTFLEALSAGFIMVAQWESIFFLAIGVTIGVVAGAIPGMSATMAVALTLPFTFALQPIFGILLLLGVYKGGIFGGSIPAILIKTPGTPASSATALDGYPMAEQGRAGEALSMSLYASCIADLISNLALIVFAAWLASFALNFGPPEMFTLIVFSLTIIAGVSGDSLVKGIVAASLGLLLATVGLDLIAGSERLTFGSVDMRGGLNFIAVLIGLFALPEIIAYMRKSASADHRVRGMGYSKLKMVDFRRSLKSIFRGSAIGVFLGAIPGIGAAPSAFLSYSEARRASPNRDNFGKGEVEGVAAAEAGNNGVAGATLIPLLSLGIPGDVITAIIIGAFMVHNLTPGPLLFVNNADLVYALFIGLIASSFLLLIIGSVAIRAFRYIADVPSNLLFPGVLVLCIYGVYAVNNSIFDVAVMLVMGVVGYIMLILRFPAAPFLIGFILGPMLENNFRQALLMSRGDLSIFARGPITILFLCMTVISVVLIIRSTVKAARLKRELGAYGEKSAPQGPKT
ncbi:putative tricarboxylic transport membrane protein [Roseinatronobacter monicus]|uniref:Putative tricarboxylic transport membrane protein n=2 Tax=Roseinatronobacter monicus TaxID=393481 RepID=A0A543KIA3_9RHOB|nr:tripartite tricarboxylate transporter permease [Roseinatronobacter monicus]TQM94802.1 putative tricarboxylic transport membrane protein [Roseinatronobacter monicus]